jgi:hypothetical protein
MIKKFLFLLLFTSSFGFAQYGYRDGNRIGISGGVSQTTLFTKNFNSSPETGFAGGLSVRGNYYNNWSMIYGMQFFSNNFSLESNFDQKVKYNIQGFTFTGIGRSGPKKTSVSGPSLQAIKGILGGMRAGEFVMFSDIRAVGPSGPVFLENVSGMLQ